MVTNFYRIFLFVLVLAFVPVVVKATSGACSWHSAVDCGRGRQPDGTVYCNDGWTDSMVLYDYMVKCKPNVNTGCYYYSPECKYLNDTNKFFSARDKAKANLQKEIQYYKNNLDGIRDKNGDYYTFVKRILDGLYIKKGRIDKNYMDYICDCTRIDDVFYIYSSDSYTPISEVNDNRIKIPKEVAEGALCLLQGKTYDKELNKCVYGDNNYDSICKKDYGQNSYYTGKMNDENKTICGCLPGYIWKGASCASTEEKQICEVNVFYFPAPPLLVADAKRMYGPKKDAGCDCPDNYVWQNNQCVLNKNTLENNSSNNLRTQSDTEGKVMGEITVKKDAQKAVKEKTLASVVASLGVRKSPSAKAKVVWSIKKGKSYVIIGAQADWYQIKISNKLSGWVMKKYVKTKK